MGDGTGDLVKGTTVNIPGPWGSWSTNAGSSCAYSWLDIAAMKAALERIEAKVNEYTFKPSNTDNWTATAQTDDALDDREHRALVMMLRALRFARKQVIDQSDYGEIDEALTIARFMLPEAFAEAARDEEGGG